MSKNYNFVIVVVEGWEFVRSLDAVARWRGKMRCESVRPFQMFTLFLESARIELGLLRILPGISHNTEGGN